MNQERIYSVLRGPHFSEKAAKCSETARQFVFNVAGDSNKLEIKKAVEKLFSVKVSKVQVVNLKGKSKRNRYGLVRKQDVKKAYVRLVEGHEIDFSVVE
jgi:large subunit ribosomal protein L23